MSYQAPDKNTVATLLKTNNVRFNMLKKDIVCPFWYTGNVVDFSSDLNSVFSNMFHAVEAYWVERTRHRPKRLKYL